MKTFKIIIKGILIFPLYLLKGVVIIILILLGFINLGLLWVVKVVWTKEYVRYANCKLKTHSLGKRVSRWNSIPHSIFSSGVFMLILLFTFIKKQIISTLVFILGDSSLPLFRGYLSSNPSTINYQNQLLIKKSRKHGKKCV